ncbi:DUF1330 domain-containing protein [Rhizobium calliandrae]|uniref:DUF1330 domain-containing protein n=1 Tax=Rhizobium calliandrae TaxID=1312182 RepID=A0ABT7KQ09_9HYPH|nr:DUF1330 domain-containing protein [Rhizobium calliandrae]MDL2410516.1 DUF1330 domain-containing protein [Rhizobium calliandrae]
MHYGELDVLESPPIEGAVILEFPDVEAARGWYRSDACRSAARRSPVFRPASQQVLKQARVQLPPKTSTNADVAGVWRLFGRGLYFSNELPTRKETAAFSRLSAKRHDHAMKFRNEEGGKDCTVAMTYEQCAALASDGTSIGRG